MKRRLAILKGLSLLNLLTVAWKNEPNKIMKYRIIISTIVIGLLACFYLIYTSHHPGMLEAREDHAAVLLQDGRVFIVGGHQTTEMTLYDRICMGIKNRDIGFIFNGAGGNERTLGNWEIFDPKLGYSTVSGEFEKVTDDTRRPVLASLENGNILVGDDKGQIQVFQINSLSWKSVNRLSELTDNVNAFIPLTDGRVLVLDEDSQTVVQNCELYDPKNNTLSKTSSYPLKCNIFSHVRLKNGKVLVMGGLDGMDVLSQCELYDPKTGQWSRTGDLLEPRDSPGAVVLPDGRVFAFGGMSDQTTFLGDGEFYDSDKGVWSKAPGKSDAMRNSLLTFMLRNGTVLEVDPTGTNLYDPKAGTWKETGEPKISRSRPPPARFMIPRAANGMS
jgi:hypothetical protein